ncbi:MAG: DMT family transporter, partial [Acidimicrobiia bacterium]
LILLPIQLAVSVAMLAVLIGVTGQAVSWSPEMRRLGALGILNPGVSYALGLVGLTYITASLSVLLWATEPLLILVLAWGLFGDMVTRQLVAAAVVAATGVILVIFEGGSAGRLVGVALTMAAVAACAVYTVITRKLMVQDSALAVVTVQQICALAFSLALAAVVTIVGHFPVLSDVTAAAWISAILSGLLYYAIAFWFYLAGLRRVSAAVAGMFINLIPIFGIAAGHVLLNERLTARQWIGALLIVAAVAAILYEQSRRESASASADIRPSV